MKRIIALLLVLTMILTGCAQPQVANTANESEDESSIDIPGEATDWLDTQQEFSSLDNEDLLFQVENLVYRETVQTLNSEEYLVENVSAVYISKEYLEEVAFNSQSNIYFGYTLSELDSLFQGTRYIFTLGDDGQTTIQELQEIEDTSNQIMLKNVAIGTGVILVCVTVSAVTGGAGAPAVSMIFAASAKTGTIMALSSGGLGAVSAGIVRGIQTGDFNEAMEAAALAGSEGFKWGAIIGSLEGGITQTVALKGASLNGLTMNEAAKIQKESGLPLSFIKNFHSMNEYNVYKNAGLQLTKVNGKLAYTQKIDWDFIGDVADGRTNAQRVIDGLAPLDSTGSPYELHHIGQKADSPLAILTKAEHHGNDAILHDKNIISEIDRTAFNAEKKQFWKALLSITQN